MILILCGWLSTAKASDPTREEFFEKFIRPVLVENCYECHSEKSKSIKAGLRLDSRHAMIQGGDSGPVLEPGKPEESTLLLAVMYEGDAVEMPPKGKLPASVIANFRKWIADGAYDPRNETDSTGKAEQSWSEVFQDRLAWWSFQPLAQIQPPVGKEPNPVDRFLSSRLRQEGLTFSEEADRETLLRRLSIDLTGLPPTETEIRQYLADKSPHAYEKQVDRLLSSPHFGERMARRWMDLTHYSETVGSEQDALIPYAWAYRDYLIRAFNQDLPYDQLLREHLAGDLIENPRRDPVTGLAESPIGTTWTRFVEYYHSPVDVKNEEIVVIDNQIDTLGKTFLGLTIACARCHDHKFDPIGTDDFYSLYGIFRNSRATVHSLADPDIVNTHLKDAESKRNNVRKVLAEEWKSRIIPLSDQFRQSLTHDQPNDPNVVTFLNSAKASPLKWAYPIAIAQQDKAQEKTIRENFHTALKTVKEQGTASWKRSGTKQKLIADFSDPDSWPADWAVFSSASQSGSRAGTFRIGGNPEKVVETVRPAGFYSDSISEKMAVTLRSPEFTLNEGSYSVLVSGTANARLRLVVDNFQGVDILFGGVTPVLNNPRLTWVKLPVREIWKGQQAYLELVTRDHMPSAGVIRDLKQLPKDGRSSFGIKYVVHHETNDPVFADSDAFIWSDLEFPDQSASGITDSLSRFFQTQLEHGIAGFESGSMTDAQASLIQDLLDANLLLNRMAPDSPLARAVTEFRKSEEKIDLAARSVGITEGGKTAVAQSVFLRGDHRRKGPTTPPSDLKLNDSWNSDQADFKKAPRMALADSWNRSDHPLVNRVIVNRIWSWYFGQGLFNTPDNVGLLGEKPSHPDLLDWLAREFVRENRSFKNLSRMIVTSRAYRQNSHASQKANEIDPTNQLLSHASVRRLDAESLRDAILTASGRLDRTLYGDPIATPQPEGLTDDKKPVSGPLDGHGRRSLYLNVRKNFPVEFLEVFDRPRPTLTVGKRNVSNQPAQALAMLNDPFLKAESQRLGTQLAEDAETPAPERIESLYLRLFGRHPNAKETGNAQAFLDGGASWTDLVEALFGTKEFLFLP